jgi:hypothetical protein
MGLVTGDATKAAAYAALHLAREGLPKPDEAETLWGEAWNAYDNQDEYSDGHEAAIATIRAFLTKRDAERDMAELVKASYHALNWLKP